MICFCDRYFYMRMVWNALLRVSNWLIYLRAAYAIYRMI